MIITEHLEKVLESNRRQWPCHTNRISGLDDPCERRLYYHRAAYDKAEPHSIKTAGIFATGNILESVIGRIVSEVGEAAYPQFRIIAQQIPAVDDMFKRFEITGTIDGLLQSKLSQGDEWVTVGVVDIKTSSPMIYPSINSYEDLSKYAWTRKYRGQLMLYALGANLERCFILFVNKSNLYDMKFIEFAVDYEYAEELLQKAGRINEAIESENPPDKLNDPDECPRCQFKSICMPEYVTGGNMQINTDTELEEVLNGLEELAETKKEIKDLEKRRDQLLIKGTDMACGDWLVLWKMSVSHRKAQEAKEVETWRKKIVHK